MIFQTMNTAKFSIGQIIDHKLFGYRGVIADVDASYQGGDEWYEQVALSCPPKEKPWYRVLVDNASHETYVAERNLEQSALTKPVTHPMIDILFDDFKDGVYQHKYHCA